MTNWTKTPSTGDSPPHHRTNKSFTGLYKANIYLCKANICLIKAFICLSKATVWLCRATVWLSKATVCLCRATVWLCRATVCLCRATVWLCGATVCLCRATVWLCMPTVCLCRETICLCRAAICPKFAHTLPSPRNSPSKIRPQFPRPPEDHSCEGRNLTIVCRQRRRNLGGNAALRRIDSCLRRNGLPGERRIVGESAANCPPPKKK